MRVAEGQQGRLHQLREKDVLPDQHKLRMLLPALASVRLSASVRLLHHAEDGDQQTCRADQSPVRRVRARHTSLCSLSRTAVTVGMPEPPNTFDCCNSPAATLLHTPRVTTQNQTNLLLITKNQSQESVQIQQNNHKVLTFT